MVWGVDGGWFDKVWLQLSRGSELGLGSLPQREVFGKLTETGEFANFAHICLPEKKKLIEIQLAKKPIALSAS